MAPTSRRKLLWLTLAAAAGCLLVFGLLFPVTPRPRAPNLRLVGQPQMSNRVMFITIILSNGNSAPLNIMDDVDGDALAGIDNGSGSCIVLKNIANSMKLNLAPGASLTNTVQVPNPPVRFQLLFEARDFAWMRHRRPVEVLKYWAARATLRRPTPPDYILWARSPWIITGNVSNTTQSATGQPKLFPTESFPFDR